jgi:hypothetical protein
MLGILDDLPSTIRQAVQPVGNTEAGGSSQSEHQRQHGHDHHGQQRGIAITDGFLKHAKAMMGRLFGLGDVTSYRETFLSAADSADSKGHAVMSIEVIVVPVFVVVVVLAVLYVMSAGRHAGMSHGPSVVSQLVPLSIVLPRSFTRCQRVISSAGSPHDSRRPCLTARHIVSEGV